MSEIPVQMSEMARHAGLVHKVMRAADRAGLTPHDLNALAEDDSRFRQIFGVMHGWMEMKSVEFKIDCDQPADWEWGSANGSNWPIERYRRHGTVTLIRNKEELFVNGRRIIFHTIETQPTIEISGEHQIPRMDETAIRRELAGKDVLNHNVMLFLLRHPQLIPDAWQWIGNPGRKYHKSLGIYFWGTEVRNKDGCLSVPRMYHVRTSSVWGSWGASPGWIGKNQYIPGVAAVLEAA